MVCDIYKQKSAKERRELVDTHRCYNCLGWHLVSECPSTKSCIKCAARHHSSLHEAYVPAVVPATESTVHTAQEQSDECAPVLLATARVQVSDRFGILHAARVLVDPGSETSLIAESLVQRLRLPRTPSAVAIYGVGGLQSGVSRGRVTLTVSPRCACSAIQISALVAALDRVR